MKRASAFALAVAFLATGATLSLVAARGASPATTIDERVHRIASTLRCPVCQDLSVADSPSLVAGQIRATIARRLRAGQTPAQITAYFVSRYGESILLSPPGRGIDLLAWIVPGLLVAAGLAILVLALVRWSRRVPGPPLPAIAERDRALLDRELRALDREAP